MKSNKIVYIDMDEVLVDFHSNPNFPIPKDHYGHPFIYCKTFFRDLLPLDGALRAASLIIANYDVYILTKPVYNSPFSYSEKVEWIRKYLPMLLNKIIMTQNKSLMIGDYLIDDNLSNINTFKGKGITFCRGIPPKIMWDIVLSKLRINKEIVNETANAPK